MGFIGRERSKQWGHLVNKMKVLIYMSLSALVFLGWILLLVLAISGSDKVPNGRFCSLTSDGRDVCQNLGDKIW